MRVSLFREIIKGVSIDANDLYGTLPKHLEL